MNTATIRQKFLDFFRGHDHRVKPSASLIPHDDPTLLFTSAGMAPFKPYFLGLKTDIKRAASCQKCFRTTDIENVGYTARHLTFFEMLGNFSFGDYFKKEAIFWAWEFITKELRLSPDRLYVSVHHSDDEAFTIWHRDMNLPADRIVKLGDKDNFWTIGIGPSGPCSEIYYDQGEKIGCGSPQCAPGCDCPRFLEFWNLVFTQYDRAEDGTLSPLEKRNIDTGMGLERLASIMQGVTDNFDNDIFQGIVKPIEVMTGHAFNESPKIRTAMKVVGDHVRALSFALADGGMPGNEGRGYVLRKILRRASRFGFSYLGRETPFLYRLVPDVIRIMSFYGELKANQSTIEKIIKGEEERFLQTLRVGTDMLNGFLDELKKRRETILAGAQAFMLHDTYGFPLDLTREICAEQGLKVDEPGFEQELGKQRERGRANVVAAFVNFQAVNPADYPATYFSGYVTMSDSGTVLDIVDLPSGECAIITDRTPFYAESGGQVGDKGSICAGAATLKVRTTEKAEEVFLHIGNWESGERFPKGTAVALKVEESSRRATMRNHTATHLLHKALRETLGDHVKQAGSMVSPERLRFDFTHLEAIPPEALHEIEARVNRKVMENLPVNVREMSYDAALKTGAMALFGEKYGDTVRVITVGKYSQELCGGTHIQNSAEIGMFAIATESSIAAGIRRIEAVTGTGAYEKLCDLRSKERQLVKLLDSDAGNLVAKVEKTLIEQRELKHEIEALRKSQARGRIDELRRAARQFNGVSAIIGRTDGLSVDEMKSLTDDLVGNSGKTMVLLAAGGEKAAFVLKISKDLVGNALNAGKLVKEIAKVADGSGGGRPDMATAGGKAPEKVDEALAAAEKMFQEILA